MSTVICRRCGETRAPVPYRPFPSELGGRILAEICNVCWGEWLQLQQQLINHYGLNVREPSAKEFLTGQLEQFLFTTARQS